MGFVKDTRLRIQNDVRDDATVLITYRRCCRTEGCFDISEALDVFDFSHVSPFSRAAAPSTVSLRCCVCPSTDSCSSRIALGQDTQTSGSSESASKNHCQPQIDDGLCLSDTLIKAACLFLVLIFMHSEDRMFLLLFKRY